MMRKQKIFRIIYVTGIIALIAGIIDPLEGSVFILTGSALISLSTFLAHDRHKKFFLVSIIMIVTGVLFLFYLSSLGGFGGTSKISWWWSVLIIPYPIGWFLDIVLLIVRVIQKKKQQSIANGVKVTLI